jgi:hypothetical protein
MASVYSLHASLFLFREFRRRHQGPQLGASRMRAPRRNRDAQYARARKKGRGVYGRTPSPASGFFANREKCTRTPRSPSDCPLQQRPSRSPKRIQPPSDFSRANPSSAVGLHLVSKRTFPSAARPRFAAPLSSRVRPRTLSSPIATDGTCRSHPRKKPSPPQNGPSAQQNAPSAPRHSPFAPQNVPAAQFFRSAEFLYGPSGTSSGPFAPSDAPAASLSAPARSLNGTSAP